MIDYDDLRKKAEAIMPDNEGNYDFDDLFLRGEVPDEIADYIEAMTPDTTLRLLDIIEMATETLGFVKRHSDEIETVGLVTETLDEIAKLKKE